MIHGFRGTHHGLELIASNLRDQFRVVVPDLPGFGDGDKLDDYSIDSYVRWLHRIILTTVSAHSLNDVPQEPRSSVRLESVKTTDSTGFDSSRIILLGHSFGSIVTSAYAAKYPETLSKLILVNPIGAPALKGPRKLLTQGAIFYYFIGRKLPAKLANAWLASPAIVQIMSSVMAKTKDKDLRRFIHRQHHTHFSRFHDADSLGQSFKTSVSHSVRDYAPDITTETLLIAGDRDDITPLNKQLELVKLFPKATLRVIKNVGHLTHYETPAEVSSMVKSFLKSL